MSKLRLGLLLPNQGVVFGAVTTRELLELAEEADATGVFDAIFVGDNLLAKPRLESVTLLSALAMRTKKARLGTACMASFPLRDPIVLAAQWAALDNLCEGRSLLVACIGGAAVVQRGAELRLRAPQIDLRIKDKELASAETLWPATIDLRPTPRKAGGRTFARWSLRLKSGARFLGDRLVVPRGGTFIAYDDKGVRQISGAVGRATVFLKQDKRRWNPTRLLCTKGVKALLHGKDKAEVTARQMEFWIGRKELDLRGDARVKAEGWAPEATFQRLIFQLTKDGVDLKRAAEISIREPRR